MINNIRMMGGNAGTKNTASSDTNVRQICVSIEKRKLREIDFRRISVGLPLIARDSFFMRAHAIKAYIAYVVRRVTRKCIRYALRDNRISIKIGILAHECTHANRITIFLIIVPVISLNQSSDRKRSSPIFAEECYHHDCLRFIIIAIRLRRMF